MTNPIMRIHDIETGEVIDREMTDAEYQIFITPPERPASEAQAK